MLVSDTCCISYNSFMLKVHSFKVFVSYFILISKTYNGYVFSVENELEMVNHIDWLFPTRHKSLK